MNRIPTTDDVIRIGNRELLVIEIDSNTPTTSFLTVPYVTSPDGVGDIAVSSKNTMRYSVDYSNLEIGCAAGAKNTKYKLSDVALIGKATWTKTINVVKFKAV